MSRKTHVLPPSR